MTDLKEKILMKHLRATAKESKPSQITAKAFEEIYEAMEEYRDTNDDEKIWKQRLGYKWKP